jgi:hypothetical protein
MTPFGYMKMAGSMISLVEGQRTGFAGDKRGREEEGEERMQEESTTTIGNATSGCTTSSLVRVGGEAVSRVGPAARREEGGVQGRWEGTA